MAEHTEALYKALFALEDVREILRQTAPGHKLSGEERKKVAEAISTVRESLKVLEGLG